MLRGDQRFSVTNTPPCLDSPANRSLLRLFAHVTAFSLLLLKISFPLQIMHRNATVSNQQSVAVGRA